jgi:hypothetical protein
LSGLCPGDELVVLEIIDCIGVIAIHTNNDRCDVARELCIVVEACEECGFDRRSWYEQHIPGVEVMVAELRSVPEGGGPAAIDLAICANDVHQIFVGHLGNAAGFFQGVVDVDVTIDDEGDRLEHIACNANR